MGDASQAGDLQGAPKGNVGDDYSAWLFSRALGDQLAPDGEILLFGVGSVLSAGFEAAVLDDTVRARAVFGSGARGPDTLPDIRHGEWQVYCVRGPLTACIAGLDCTAAVADPAVLAPRIMPVAADPDGPVGIVPYYTASHYAWTKIARRLGWRLVSPHLSVEEFVTALAGCSRVWCESMHGAIFADAYGVPWRPVSATSVIGERRTHAFKWTDWSSSVGLGFDPLPGLPLFQLGSGPKCRLKERVKIEIMVSRLYSANRQDRHLLSQRRILADRQDRLLELMDTMCRELAGASSKLPG